MRVLSVFNRVVASPAILAMVLVGAVGAGCKDEPAVSAPSPGTSAVEPAAPEEEPASTASASSGDVSEQVAQCFSDFESELSGLPLEQRAAKISEVSAVVAECSSGALRDGGYEITEEIAQDILRAMQEQSQGFMQRLIEMGNG